MFSSPSSISGNDAEASDLGEPSLRGKANELSLSEVAISSTQRKGKLWIFLSIDWIQCIAISRPKFFHFPARNGIQTRRSSLSFEPIQAPLQIRSRTEAMKKVNSQLSLSFHTRVSNPKNAVSYLSPLTGYWSFKASTASTNPFPVLGGPLLQGNLFHFHQLGISLIHHPSRAIRSRKHAWV